MSAIGKGLFDGTVSSARLTRTVPSDSGYLEPKLTEGLAADADARGVTLVTSDAAKSSTTIKASSNRVTCMQKTQVYLRKEELDALRKAAARSGCSIAELVRDAIRKVVLKPEATGPVAIWDGEPKRSSMEHDSVHDEP